MARSVFVLLVAVLLSGAWAAAGATQAERVPCPVIADVKRCPDIVVDAVSLSPNPPRVESFPDWHCAVKEGMVEAGPRRLVRFTFTTPNVGEGDLRIGPPGDHPAWFVPSTCHGHYHFTGYADYRLWKPEDHARWTALRAINLGRPATDILAETPDLTFVAGTKLGFCAMDVVPLAAGLSRKYHCGWQGISVGWADRYDWTLDGQWIDVTGLPEGYYVLEAEVNPERLFEESRVDNNAWGRLMYLHPPDPSEWS